MKKLTCILFAVIAMVFVSCGGSKESKKGYDYKPEVKGTFVEYYNIENVNLSFREGHNEFLNSDYIEVVAKFDVVKNDKDIKNEIGNLTPLCTNGSSSWWPDWGNDGNYRWGCCLKVLDPQFTEICTLYDYDINPLLEHFTNPGDKFSVEWKREVSSFAVGSDIKKYESLKKFVDGELEGDLHTEVLIGGGVWSGTMQKNYK